MSSKVRTLGAALVACALVSTWSVSIASGAEAQASAPPRSAAELAAPSTTTAPSPFALTVSPTRLVVGPDDIAKTQQIKVSNSGQSALSVVAQKRNFVANVDGTLTYQDEAPYSASNWVTLDTDHFDLAPGAIQIVTATISVPPGPEPGDHQLGLVFLVPAGNTTDNIKINRGIGLPIYIAVPGPTDDSASLSDLDVPGFVTGGPVAVTAKVHDTGNVHRDFRAATPLRVDVAGSAAAFPDFTVVRGATRDIATTWDPPLFCICHPEVSFTNADGAVQSMTVRVIVFPVVLVAAVLGGLLLFVLVLWLSRRRYRSNVRTAAVALNEVREPVDA
jgi:hypothetical protein